MEPLNMGGSIVSNNILSGCGKLKWCVREESLHPVDNGWRFYSDIDTAEYLAVHHNLTVCSWDTVFQIEPAVHIIFDQPVGTELTLIRENGEMFFCDTNSGERVF